MPAGNDVNNADNRNLPSLRVYLTAVRLMLGHERPEAVGS